MYMSNICSGEIMKKQKGFGVFESILVVAVLATAMVTATQMLFNDAKNKKLQAAAADLYALNEKIEAVKNAFELTNNSETFITNAQLVQKGILGDVIPNRAATVTYSRGYGDIAVKLQKKTDGTIKQKIEVLDFGISATGCDQTHINYIQSRVPNVFIQNCP